MLPAIATSKNVVNIKFGTLVWTFCHWYKPYERLNKLKMLNKQFAGVLETCVHLEDLLSGYFTHYSQ